MYYTKIYHKFPLYFNDLLLTPPSPFNIKCKKLNAKSFK